MYGKPSWKASAFAICFSVARFMRTRTTPSAFAGTLVLGQRDAEVLFRDEARLNQALTDFLAHPEPSGKIDLEPNSIVRTGFERINVKASCNFENVSRNHQL